MRLALARERRTGLAFSSLRERARTSHNGNSRKFVCMIMLALKRLRFRSFLRPAGANSKNPGLPTGPPNALRSDREKCRLRYRALKRNRSYERLHRPFKHVLILSIMDINLHAREASMFSIRCLRLIFRCVRRCVLHLKRRTLRLRSRSFRSSTVIRCSRSSTCFSSPLIS